MTSKDSRNDTGVMELMTATMFISAPCKRIDFFEKNLSKKEYLYSYMVIAVNTIFRNNNVVLIMNQ